MHKRTTEAAVKLLSLSLFHSLIIVLYDFL